MYDKSQILALIREKGIGPKTFWKTIAEDPTVLKTIPIPRAIIQEINAHQEKGFAYLTAFDAKFPKSLRDLGADCPPILSIGGNPDFLTQPIIAIVGARNASHGGLTMAFSLARDLTAAGFSIVSGLARGIDGSAHKGSLQSRLLQQDNGVASTIGVLAGGIDHIYPNEHTALYQDIYQQGCLVSEMPLGMAPGAPLFARRNRLIAALCQGIIIIEAAAKSGTLITCHYALDFGKDVFVVPGSPLDPRSCGGNHLIKQGGMLIDSAQDVIDYYQQNYLHRPAHAPKPKTHISVDIEKHHPEQPPLPADKCWLHYLGTEPLDSQLLYQKAREGDPARTFAHFMAEITHLELEGVVIRTPQGMIQKIIQ